MPEPVPITVDGVEHQARAGEMLIKAAQDQGTYIPRFCWHERMEPVGMCRMCLVEIDTPRGPMLVTACTTPVADNMAVDTQSDKAAEFCLRIGPVSSSQELRIRPESIGVHLKSSAVGAGDQVRGLA